MSRYIDADALIEWIDEYVSVFKKSDTREIKGYVEHQPTIDAIPIEHINLLNLVSVVRCKECKHRPIKEDADGEDYGFNIVAPEGSSLCPCLVDDGWYSWMPKDNFFCGYGEREDEQ